MKTYELTYIISPEISFEEAEAIAKELVSLIQSSEGVILRQDNPMAKTLAYTIKTHASGFVGCIGFQLESEKIGELQEGLQKDGKILRHMLIIKEAGRKKKERKSKTSSLAAEEPKKEIAVEKEADAKPARNASHSDAGGEKLELKDIEQKLDEILGE